MYPQTSPTTPVDVDHRHTLAAGDQAAARPARCASRPSSRVTAARLVGYGRARRDPADLQLAVIELHELGVHSEHIYLDRAGDRSHDGLQLALQQLNAGDILVASRLSRLGRSLAGIHRVVDQLIDRDARLVIGTEPFESMPPARLLQLLTQFQLALVDQAIEDADWTHRQRTDMRHPHTSHRRRPNRSGYTNCSTPGYRASSSVNTSASAEPRRAEPPPNPGAKRSLQGHGGP